MNNNPSTNTMKIDYARLMARELLICYADHAIGKKDATHGKSQDIMDAKTYETLTRYANGSVSEREAAIALREKFRSDLEQLNAACSERKLDYSESRKQSYLAEMVAKGNDTYFEALEMSLPVLHVFAWGLS